MNNIKGFKELSRRLKNMEGKVAQKVVRRGSARMAQIVAKEMKQAVPRGKGNLRKSITYSNKRNRRGGFSAKVGAFRTARADGFYAKFVEFGTKKHTIRGKTKKSVSVGGSQFSEVQHPGNRANPFIEPAFKRSYRRAMNESGRLMFKLIAELR